jgi:V8-like Glu-specific endopeptidase
MQYNLVRTLQIQESSIENPNGWDEIYGDYEGLPDVYRAQGTWNERVLLTVPNPEAVVPAAAINSIRSPRDAQTLLSTVRSRSALLFMLKATLFNMMLSGQIVAASPVSSLDAVISRQMALIARLTDLACYIVAFTAWIADILMNIPRALNDLMSDEVRALIDLVIVIASIMLVWKMLRYLVHLVATLTGRAVEKFVLRAPAKIGETKYIARRLTEHGVTHEVVIEGKLWTLNDTLDTMVLRQDEMAIPGSSFFPSKSNHVGAIMVASEAAELAVIGTFFRLDDHLVTAAHVANAISSGIARVFLTGMKNTKKELYHVDTEGVCELEQDFFALDSNEIKANYDVFARKLTPKQWARIKVNRVSYRLDSQYNQIVSAYGFNGSDGLFVTSSGKTLPGSGLEELWHTASTHPGFSGSPLFSGSSVVGMHVAAAGDKNVAIRMELIRMLLTAVPESNAPDITYREHDFKFKGRSAKVKELLSGQLYGFEDSSGRVDLGWSREDIDEMVDLYHEGNPAHQHAIEQMMDADTSVLSTKQRKRLTRALGYEDESADVMKRRPEFEQINGVIRYPRERPVHCGGVPAECPEVADYISKNESKLSAMGYDPTKYAYPVINAETEATSVVKHLELYEQRVQSVVKPPTQKELDTVVSILAEFMSANKFEPDVDYRSKGSVLRVLNSTAVRDSKSPGHPYQANGLATNESVLNKFTKDGFAELVLKEWDSKDDLFAKMFGKAEPNKRKKLESQMMRVVSGLPLHEMVKHNCIFGNFATSLVENWKKSPVKFAFNPQRPGDIKHLAEIFPNGVGESDKGAWDYNFFFWLYEICYRTTQELAVQPADMADEDFDQYLKDIEKAVMRVARDTKYRCTNGEVFGPREPGCMKSGFLMTIAYNSMGQLALHILTMIRMGYSREVILGDDYAIIAGGDDVLQTFPSDFPVENYQNEMKILGFDVTDFVVHKQFEGCEFFSNKFMKLDGVWTYHPTRFTKHIAHLKHTKIEFVASALSCHMLNHVWDSKKFDFFDKMFRDLRKMHPEHFPLNLYKKRRALQYKVLGFE